MSKGPPLSSCFLSKHEQETLVEVMEADSTTFEEVGKTSGAPAGLDFPVSPKNKKFFTTFILQSIRKDKKNATKAHFISWIQKFGLIPSNYVCNTCGMTCQIVLRSFGTDCAAWICSSCKKLTSIRYKTFFNSYSVCLENIFQGILAWAEDLDYIKACQYIDVDQRQLNSLYKQLDSVIIEEQHETRLGGAGSVVLMDMYRHLSPDTTNQHHHQILMLTDTNHVPTQYYLHVITGICKNTSPAVGTAIIKVCLSREVSKVCSRVVRADSLLVASEAVGALPGARALRDLLRSCDPDMQHFLRERVWRGASSVCAAALERCAAAGFVSKEARAPALGASVVCALRMQKYLHCALYKRHHHTDGFYEHILRLIISQSHRWR